MATAILDTSYLSSHPEVTLEINNRVLQIQLTYEDLKIIQTC